MPRWIWTSLLVACSGPAASPSSQLSSAEPSAARGAPAAVPVEATPPAASTATPGSLCGIAPAGMACIPGGHFLRGLDDDTHRCLQTGQPADLVSAAQPAMVIELSVFLLDETEVTVAAYRACVETGECPDARPIYPDFGAPDQPMTGLSWHDAATYCRAQGKRLPTEAEWERAARGPAGTLTSFGNEPVTCTQAVVRDARGRSCGVAKAAGDPATGKVLPVKSRPAGHYGLFDMMGNAEEWVADWWTPSYAACGEECQGRNPKGPCGGGGEACPKHSFKVVRGGSWYWGAEHATATHRRRHFPHNRRPSYHHFGFRCARSAAPPEGEASAREQDPE